MILVIKVFSQETCPKIHEERIFLIHKINTNRNPYSKLYIHTKKKKLKLVKKKKKAYDYQCYKNTAENYKFMNENPLK